jgi:hypothetical protein
VEVRIRMPKILPLNCGGLGKSTVLTSHLVEGEGIMVLTPGKEVTTGVSNYWGWGH